MKRIRCFILFACLAIIKPAFADINDQKKACLPAQKAAADEALKTAKAGISKVVSALKSNSSSDEMRYIKWFGAGTPTDKQSVLRIYEGTLSHAVFSAYWCPNNNIPELAWDVGDIAAVHPSAPGAIFFTPDFFVRPAVGKDSQAGTIVHELSHLSGATLKPEVYQPGPAKALATSNPANAGKNGDNFEYYFEDLLFGVP
ncbi:M35 family metallo-endopeptidase [Bradyrhizobium sp. USDA 4469]